MSSVLIIPLNLWEAYIVSIIITIVIFISYTILFVITW